MIKNYCDKCGKEIKKIYELHIYPSKKGYLFEIQLCKEHNKEFIKMLENTYHNKGKIIDSYFSE